MNWHLRIPSALYRVAVKKSGGDAKVSEWVNRAIVAYVTGDTAEQALSRAGGHARAQSLTPERRLDIARRAGLASQQARIRQQAQRGQPMNPDRTPDS